MDAEHATPAASPSPSPSGAATAPPEPTPDAITLTIEEPFRIDRRVVPRTREAFLADLKERTRWNKGDMGKLTGEPPPVPGHPAPKVILDVTHAKGPLTQADAQRVLRAKFWMKAVQCFSLGAYKDQKLRGTATLAVSVDAKGHVQSASVRATTFADDEVNQCLAEKMRALTSLPKARAGSRFHVELQIGHGDEPVAPPASLIVPGDGELAPDAIKAVVEQARPALEACYHDAQAYAPELWGRLGVRFHVTAKGKTDEVFEAESQFPDERVTLCVLRALRKVEFPKPAVPPAAKSDPASAAPPAPVGDLRFIVPLRFRSKASVIE